jgi:hypothetical protein
MIMGKSARLLKLSRWEICYVLKILAPSLVDTNLGKSLQRGNNFYWPEHNQFN